MDQLPRLGKRELICLLLFTCNYAVSVWRGFLFLWVLGMGYVILLWHSLSLPLITIQSVHSGGQEESFLPKTLELNFGVKNLVFNFKKKVFEICNSSRC